MHVSSQYGTPPGYVKQTGGWVGGVARRPKHKGGVAG